MRETETSPWRRLRDGWMVIVARFGGVQTQVILAGFYLFLLGPVSLFQALGRTDLLDKRALRGGGSAWRDADTGGADLERAKLQS